MSYVGSSAAVIPVGFSGVNSQSFDGDGSTVAFTLNRPVSAVNAIEVMVNNVQQSPYDGSYSVSSTTLTFSAAPSSGTANIYVVYRDFPVGSITDTNAVQKTGDTMTGNLIVDANVGIGTGSPTQKLDLSSSTGAKIAFTNTGTRRYSIGNNSTSLTFTDESASTERMRINASGEVLIGGTAQGRETNLSVDGTYQDPTGVWTQVGIYSTDTQATNKGGTIGFGGQDGSVAKQQFAAIKGAKENSTSANYAGYMAFYTRPAGDVTAERMRIDSAGRVTMPYQPVFSGNRDGKLQIVNTAGLIDFNSIVNTGSHWNTSTNTFTCPVAGRYFVSFYNLTAGSYSTGASSVNIRKNGANFYNAYTEGGTSASGDNYWNSSASGVLDCQASDTITLYIASGVAYNGYYCGATIYLIG